MKVIFSTVGTSMVKGEWRERFNRLEGKSRKERDANRKLFDELVNEMAKAADAPNFDPIVFSAETHSLHRMNVAPEDVLYFLVSDTLQGELCGEALVRISQKLWKAKAEIRVLEGLQVSDPELFRRKGVYSLVRTVKERIDHHGRKNTKFILNATGGFKATIPYMTMVGLIEGIPVQYIYERASALIELPAAPLRFDKPALEELHRLMGGDLSPLLKGMSEQELSKKLRMPRDLVRNRFKEILSFEGGRVVLTTLAQMYHERDHRPSSGRFRLK
ncbi:putative CRISPR-associated protein [Staphylospora marina]|uniref:putative CRISPR-associated protein n=1 Tax=Staphylospora marina TaxID=2490858 RepID=UPI000F5B8E78|nr:putative CRISPR-associated protein [Staphylospora marina]